MAHHISLALSLIAFARLLQFVVKTMVDFRHGVPQSSKMLLNRLGDKRLLASLAFTQQILQTLADIIIQLISIQV